MDEISYEQASKELEQILSELKSDNISIDKLAEKVERASKLAVFCNEKLRTTESKVSEIIKRLGL
ncbi:MULTISPECIES: exodeoxyribonuclease VII small subunit [Dysgonomonas]|uniref:exodeoxyribonuclease VII small subunit n=1 Tax=Dysgonomonas TaxID=156973 RepID=UPI0024BD1B61|nr:MULTISPECIES: exodeoxyribonuclease VII small subunit [Dysgonomonas]MBS5908915.1 exodeoxyribonuclease VII small subunit [Dysgonomonas mossii]